MIRRWLAELLALTPQRVRQAGRLMTALGVAALPGVFLLASWTDQPAPGPLRPEMMALPAGNFRMGSPETEEGRDANEAQRDVVLTRGFLLARTEVTQAMYRRVVGEAPSLTEYKGVSLIGDDLPVQNVRWLDAIAYCNALSKLENLKPAYVVTGEEVTWNRAADGYRLPTEAEWEYAARVGTSEVYAGISDPEKVCTYANVSDRSASKAFSWTGGFSCDDGFAGLAPVATYAANPWGIYDLTGNVWEWTWDWYTDTPDEATDPDGPESGSFRVGRGGSWGYVPRFTRVAWRFRGIPSYRDVILGFRPARSLP